MHPCDPANPRLYYLTTHGQLLEAMPCKQQGVEVRELPLHCHSASVIMRMSSIITKPTLHFAASLTLSCDHRTHSVKSMAKAPSDARPLPAPIASTWNEEPVATTIAKPGNIRKLHAMSRQTDTPACRNFEMTTMTRQVSQVVLGDVGTWFPARPYLASQGTRTACP